MRTIIIGICLFVSAVFAAPALSAQTEGAKNIEVVDSVRKTCDCVRKHPNGFPYIEQRVTTCKTYKNADGQVKSLDCLNCYALCSDKPAS